MDTKEWAHSSARHENVSSIEAKKSSMHMSVTASLPPEI